MAEIAEDIDAVCFDNGHYEIKGEIFMSIWFYKNNSNVFVENSNDQNYSDAKEISK